jgi:GT2 family glycosyltransferase
MDLLEKCLDGLQHRTGYPNLEVVIVDNGAADPRFPELLKKASSSLDLVHVTDRRDFNFSRLANGGVSRSTGEVVLLLNDDIEPIRTGWLDRMVESAVSPGAGAVGARLLYPDKSIQHAGVAMGIGGVCGHLWRGLREQDAMRCPYVVYPGERTAVTGACLAVRREVFDKAGALDEAAFPVSLNDIDFCLRVRASGFRNIYRGDAVLIHYESQSRGPDSANARTRRRLARETAVFLSRWGSEIENDPFGSPEFDLRTESGAVHYAALYNAA